MNRSSRKKTDVFTLTLPLRCESWQRDRLGKLFRVCNDIKNNLIAFELKHYRCLIEQHRWKENQAILRNLYKDDAEESVLTPFLDTRNSMMEAAGFTSGQFEKQANKYRLHYKAVGGRKELVNSHICQKIAASVWQAFAELLYGDGQEVSFSKWSEFTTIEAKSNNTGIIYRDGMVSVAQMRVPVILDQKDPYKYQENALSGQIRYCKISRRWYASGWKYFLQLVLTGKPPTKVRKDTGEFLHPMGTGRVGHDIGTQTIASVGADAVILTELADKVKGIDTELRRINRAMDRSRRACNPQMFDNCGKVIPIPELPAEYLNNRGQRKWKQSKRYRRLAAVRRELYRRQHEMRIQQHNELANQLLAFGDHHYVEDMRFRALAKRAKETKKNKNGRFVRKKRFGKSISNKSPATFIRILKQKILNAGGSFETVNTFTAKASQLNHITETYTKKNLSKRWNDMPDGTRVQRDLYSAFLIMNVDATLSQVDIPSCNKTYPQFKKLHDKEISRISHTDVVVPSSIGIHKIA